MSDLYEQCKSQAALLPPDERAELAHFLLTTLEPEEDEAAVEAAWVAEAQRRLADYRAGKATARPAAEDSRPGGGSTPPTSEDR